MGPRIGILVVVSTALILAKASPIPRDQNQDDIDNSYATAAIPTSEFSDWHNETRQRDKERRLKAIELFILEALGRTNKPPVVTQTNESQGNSRRNTPPTQPTTNSSRFQHRQNNDFPGQLDMFQASCDLPSKVDMDAWTQPGFFRMFFNLSTLENIQQVTNEEDMTEPTLTISEQGEEAFTTVQARRRSNTAEVPLITTTLPTPTLKSRRPLSTNSINIISAKLRLYKIGRGPNAEPQSFELPKTSEFCNNTNEEIVAIQNQQRYSGQGQFHHTRVVGTDLPASTEERIFVKVYWYTAPMIKHHYKKKLLFSRTLLVKESGWIDFDIQKAARMWLESKINYGLAVEVENEDNDLVDAATFFSNVDCPLTNSTPNQVLDSRRGVPFRTSRIPTEPTIRYPSPILELCTLTLPLSQSSDPVKRTVSYQLSFPSRDHSGPEQTLTKLSDTDDENSESQEERFWQSDDTVRRMPTSTTTLPPYLHRRRHHHGSSHRSALSARNTHLRDFGSSMQGDSPMVTEAPETTTQFQLDGDHPLKKIFATAKTYLSRDEMMSRRRKHGWHSRSAGMALPEDSVEEPIRFQPIILEAENIVIENSRSKRR